MYKRNQNRTKINIRLKLDLKSAGLNVWCERSSQRKHGMKRPGTEFGSGEGPLSPLRLTRFNIL